MAGCVLAEQFAPRGAPVTGVHVPLVRTRIGHGDWMASRLWSNTMGFAAFAAVACGHGPDIPHPVSATDDEYCMNCHSGRADVPETGHDRDETDCTACHEVTDRGTYPAPMPHRGGAEGKCVLCHLDGSYGASPTSHLRETDCYSCHEALQYGPWPPASPHPRISQDEAGCLACHSELEHGERPACIACHED